MLCCPTSRRWSLVSANAASGWNSKPKAKSSRGEPAIDFSAVYEQWLTSASRIVIRKPGRLVVRWRLPAASLAEAPRKPALVAAKKKLLSNTAVRRHKRLNGASGGVWCQWRHGPVCREHPGKRPSHWHRHCGCPYRAPSGLLVSRRRSRLGQGHVHYTLPARTHLHLT